MRDLLKALRGARLIARGVFGEVVISHYLLKDGNVLEVITRYKVMRPRVRSTRKGRLR
jgi:hypothetical protein